MGSRQGIAAENFIGRFGIGLLDFVALDHWL
jgi:hypothetical protein